MATITATEFKLLINDSALAAATAEAIIDQAINKLVTYGAPDIPNMGGTAGTKTWSGEQNQKGAIMEAAALWYNEYYKGKAPFSVGSVSASPPNIMGNPAVEARIKDLAQALMEVEASVG